MKLHTMSRAICLIAFLIPGCGDTPSDGPPQIRLGHDECAACGMMISEERCSAASVVVVDDVDEIRLWDDIGCLLDWEAAQPEIAVRARWMHDHETRAWITSGEAVFLISESVRTPMGSQIVAFSNANGAEAARVKHSGTTCSWAQLGAARAQWRAAQASTAQP